MHRVASDALGPYERRLLPTVYFDFSQPNILSRGAYRSDREGNTGDAARCKGHSRRCSVVAERRDADRRAVAERERSAGDSVIGIRAIVEHNPVNNIGY